MARTLEFAGSTGPPEHRIQGPTPDSRAASAPRNRHACDSIPAPPVLWPRKGCDRRHVGGAPQGEAKANSVRDLLTALAGAVVLILVAALTVPPFIDWSGQRALIDRAITQSLGTPARSEGAVDLRLLPSPHLRFDRLILGAEDGPALDAHTVDAEIALAPLLKGEVRFTGTVIERARVTLPVAQDALLLPRSGEGPRRDVVIEALSVRRLSVATVHDGAAPSEMFSADDVRLKAPALAGPWLAEGMVAGSPFHLATGTMSADGALALKLTGGGDALPRLEADARLAFKPESVESRRGLVPEAEGSAKLTVGPPVQPAGDSLPLTLSAKFEARGTTVNAKSVELELDPGGKAVRRRRLAGSTCGRPAPGWNCAPAASTSTACC